MKGRIAYFVLLSIFVLVAILAILYIQQSAPSYHAYFDVNVPVDINVNPELVLKENLISTACNGIHWSLLSAVVFLVIMYIFLFFKS